MNYTNRPAPPTSSLPPLNRLSAHSLSQVTNALDNLRILYFPPPSPPRRYSLRNRALQHRHLIHDDSVPDSGYASAEEDDEDTEEDRLRLRFFDLSFDLLDLPFESFTSTSSSSLSSASKLSGVSCFRWSKCEYTHVRLNKMATYLLLLLLHRLLPSFSLLLSPPLNFLLIQLTRLLQVLHLIIPHLPQMCRQPIQSFCEVRMDHLCHFRIQG